MEIDEILEKITDYILDFFKQVGVVLKKEVVNTFAMGLFNVIIGLVCSAFGIY